MVQPTGIHHIAVMTGDMKTQLAFFSDVLGARLVAIFDMHGVPGGIHAFVELSEKCLFSFVQLPGTEDIPAEIGRTHAGSGSGNAAAGTMQHIAFAVDSREDLLAMRDRIRSRGVNIFGPIDHGMCQSIYFAGPENLALEVAWADAGLDARRWIDPAVLARAGISPEQGAAFAAPAAYAGQGGAVPQPPHDAAKPHQAIPDRLYRQILSMPDETIWTMASNAEPPVALEEAH